MPTLSSSVRGGKVSPRFARIALEALSGGRPSDALELCSSGVEVYPWYPTGIYMLGRCYEELGRVPEAVMEFRRALRLLPDLQVFQDALSRAEEHEQAAFRAFAEKLARTLDGSTGKLTFEEYVGGVAGAGESTVEFLQERARQASRGETTEAAAPGPKQESTGKIVTVTLAEIYASQGEFREAIEAYTTLITYRPEDEERFRERIRQLKVLAETEKPLG